MNPWILMLFLFSTLVSQSAMDFFATLLILQFGLWAFAEVRTGKSLRSLCPAAGFEIFFVIWFLVQALSFALSPLENTSWISRLLEMRWVIQLYFVYWFLLVVPATEARLKTLSLFLAFCSTYAIVVWFLGFDPINKDYDLAPWVGGHRTGGFLSNAMTFAHVYGIHFCVMCGCLLVAFKEKSKNSKFFALAVLVTGIAVLLSFTRGAWIAMAMGTLAMAAIYWPRLAVFLASVGGGTLWIGTLLWPSFAERMTMALKSGDDRQWIWKGHWHIFTQHPWLGVGYGENSKIIGQAFQEIGAPAGVLESHAHNQYIHFLAGTGVIGLACYVFFLGAFLVFSFQNVRRLRHQIAAFEIKALALGGFGAQLAFCFGGLTEANFEHSKMKYVMMLVWASILWIRGFR